MQHTLIAVFEQRSEAQQALDALLGAGYTSENARMAAQETGATAGSAPSNPPLFANRGLETSNAHIEGSSTDSTYQESSDSSSFGSGVRNFFSDLFGSGREDDSRLYATAIERGHYVVTVRTETLPEVERAADIVEPFGPIDIDEKSEQWGLGGTAALQGGAATQQQSSSMSQQSLGSASTSLGSASQSTSSGSASQSTGASAGMASQQGGSQYQGSQLQESLRQGETRSIPVIQEELQIGKRDVQRGGVRIYQRTVETPFDETVGLREEQVHVERRATDKLVDPADIDAFKDSTIELRETGQEAVVAKQARQVEEVLVGKDVKERQEHIHDTLRRTEVEVESWSGDDTTGYRSHWDTHLASSGGQFDEYEPAYRYGSEARRSEMYRNRPWDDVERDLRTDWETRHPGSAWERFKAAVRHGWDRMTS